MIKAVIEKTRSRLVCHRVGGYVSFPYPSHFRLSSSTLKVFELKPFEIGAFILDKGIVTAYGTDGTQLKQWKIEELLEIL